MSSAMLVLAAIVASGIGVWLLSFVLEASRSAPMPPQTLRWAPEIPIGHLDVRGLRLRYIKAGQGPNLVLLHTLRTQLDLFEKVVPELSNHFTVYALDYPGHGYSAIPEVRYDADFFAGSVEGFLDALDLRNVTLCGVSIGGSIALILAGRRNPRVARVAAINPYDYAKGRGIARSSLAARMIATTSSIPVIGETIMRLRNVLLFRSVMMGGVAIAGSIPAALLKELYEVGNRPGHYRAFLSLLRNAASWETCTQAYRNVEVPVRLVWGEKDWSRPIERERGASRLPGAQVVIVRDGGHFLPLDRPDAVIEQIMAVGT